MKSEILKAAVAAAHVERIEKSRIGRELKARAGGALMHVGYPMTGTKSRTLRAMGQKAFTAGNKMEIDSRAVDTPAQLQMPKRIVYGNVKDAAAVDRAIRQWKRGKRSFGL